ncbi:MAG: apolipoprotein N-acyltransferase, partial [Burkholderiaceae bacterium]|nr:apolipoprotein N-acyltransferase [Burkholderiaceae bacterium]
WISGLIGALWNWYGKGQWIYMASAALVIVTIVMFGMIGKTVQWTQPTGELAVRMVQPNFEPRMLKESMADRFDQTYAYLESVDTTKFKPDVVLFPESVYPTSVQRFPSHQLARLMYWSKMNDTGLLFNAFWEPKFDDFANAAVYVDPNGQLAVYEKRHLVPFGEFVPYGFQWYIDSMRIPMGSLRAGDDNQPLMKIKGHDVSVNICYENLFGEEWIQAWQTGNPQLLVNLSNLKWFGPVRAAAQHLQISQMRALEMARPLLNVTNSGSTAVVNERGEIVHALPADAEGVLDIKVPVVSGDATPYVKMGNLPAIVWALAMLVIGFVTTLITKRSKINKFDA